MSTRSSGLFDAESSTKAIFALDVTTAGVALIILGVGILLAIAWTASSRRKSSSKTDDDSHAPLKSPIAVYAFLLPALFFLCLGYAVQASETPLKLKGTYPINDDLGLGGRRNPGSANRYTLSVLSFTFRLCDIFFTILLNGAVWLHSAHVTSNGTGTGQPSLASRLWNAFILLSMLGTGLASWAVALAGRDEQDVVDPTFSQIVERELAAQILFVIYRCVVIVASLSVSITVLRDYSDLSKNGRAGVSRISVALCIIESKRTDLKAE